MKVTRRELSNIFDVTEATISNWLKEATPIPRDESGQYETGACIRWFGTRERSKVVTSSDGNTYDPNTEKARLLHHQANNEALKERQLKGELISSEDVVKQWSDAVMAMRNKMLALPSKLAKTAINAESVKQIEREAEAMIYESLNELSIYDDRSNRSAETGVEDSGTTPKDNAIAMGRSIPKTKPRSVKRARAMEH